MLFDYKGKISAHTLLGCKCLIETNDGKTVYCQIKKFDDNHLFGELLPKSTIPYLINTFQINIKDIVSIGGAKEITFND